MMTLMTKKLKAQMNQMIMTWQIRSQCHQLKVMLMTIPWN